MSSLLLREAPAPASVMKQIWRVGGSVALATACLTLGVLLLQKLAGPSFVNELTVANPTEYSVHARVSTGDDSWLGLGVVGSGEEHTFREVIDQGDMWVVEFSFAGEVAGHLEISADALSEDDWRLEVPAEVGLVLAAEGITPQPAGF